MNAADTGPSTRTRTRTTPQSPSPSIQQSTNPSIQSRAVPSLQHSITPPLRAAGCGFTLVEMLVVIAIIGILTSLLLPALSKSKQKAVGIVCLNQTRQLMLCMMMYGTDCRDLFPPNPPDGNMVPGHNWCVGNAGHGGRAEFNPDLLKDERLSLLAPYLKGDVSVFHCPGDKRIGPYKGKDPRLIGTVVPAARTFSMNQAVGTICPGFDSGGKHQGVPTLPVNGPWLNNQNNHRRNSPWYTYGSFATIAAPGPSRLWVLVDEDAEYLNDAAFGFGMEHPMWFDAPGAYHNFGCGFGFADGHSETHGWALRSYKVRGLITNPLDQRDWEWMRERSSARANDTGPLPPPQNSSDPGTPD